MWYEAYVLLGLVLTIVNVMMMVITPRSCPHCGKSLIKGDNDPFTLFCTRCWQTFSNARR